MNGERVEDPSVLSEAPTKPSSRTVAVGSLWTANVVKLAGVAVVLNEALVREVARPLLIAASALMIAGVQALESIIDRVLAK